MESDAVYLDGSGLRPADVVLVARGRRRARLSPEALAANAAAASVLDEILGRGEPLYGVTTGVGVLRTHDIDPRERPDSQ